MNEIKEFEVLPNYHIWLKFHDGYEKTINVRPHIGKGFTNELLDENEFKKVRIEEGGGLEWENGFDMCPNYLRELDEENRNVA
jgi:hypothetical protein